ncbi:MAG: hypothetical protein HC849_01170 [Oscillatoriales cyanobacterium RU_3_3]|nr:hypothetical protein [Oscillatoriales cyanobacterium RU_3_3]
MSRRICERLDRRYLFCKKVEILLGEIRAIVLGEIRAIVLGKIRAIVLGEIRASQSSKSYNNKIEKS